MSGEWEAALRRAEQARLAVEAHRRAANVGRLPPRSSGRWCARCRAHVGVPHDCPRLRAHLQARGYPPGQHPPSFPEV